MNNGLSATVIADNGWDNIDIQFENGLVVQHRRREHFKKGSMNRQHDGNVLTIGGSSFEMPFRIRQVIEDGNMTFVLLSVPGADAETRNVYGFCDEKEIWQVESLNDKYPDRKNLPFEDIRLVGDGLLGRDFYGRRYLIDLMTGAIIRQAPSVK